MTRPDHVRALAFWLLLFHVAGALAETPRTVIDPRKSGQGWVSDMAGVIDAPTRRSINDRIESLYRRTTSGIVVVTIRRADGDDPKGFATELFNFWKLGLKGKDNGVLVLLVMEARRVEVETGYGLEGVLPDSKVGGILREHVVPRFRSGDFGGGLAAGVEAMAVAIESEGGGADSGSGTAAPGRLDSRQSSSNRNRSSGFVPEDPVRVDGTPVLAPLIGLLFVLAALCSLIFMVIRKSRVRNCSQCQIPMRLLSEDQDDAYLSADEKFEEQLGSIDYRVWRCDSCQEMKIEPAKKMWSSYEECPKCHRRTLAVHEATVREATYNRTGLIEVTKACRRPGCDYVKTHEKRIPRRQRPVVVVVNSGSAWGGSSSFGSSSGSSFSSSSSSSYSSGSFGGGSSGGGGAGSSW